MAEYTIAFRTLAAESGWNGATQQAAFVNGLSELLKDELVSHPVPKDLDKLISLSIRIDNQCWEWRREKQRSPGSDVTLRRREDSPVPVRSRLPSSPHRSPCSERISPRASLCSWVGVNLALTNVNSGEPITPVYTVVSPVIISPPAQAVV